MISIQTKTFRKKPVEIQAFQLDGDVIDSVLEAAGCSPAYLDGITFYPYHAEIKTLEGTMRADIGDWIITGVNGEKYPCKPDIFQKTYEEVVE
jgi:hypothetical protein